MRSNKELMDQLKMDIDMTKKSKAKHHAILSKPSLGRKHATLVA